MNIELRIRPVTELANTINGKVIPAQARFVAGVPGDNGSLDPVEQTTNFQLSDGLQAVVTLPSAFSQSVDLSFLSPDGSALLSRRVQSDAAGNAVYELSTQDVEHILNGKQTLPADPSPVFVTRTAKLVLTGSASLDFSSMRVALAVVRNRNQLADSGVASKFKLDGTKTAAIEMTGQDLLTLGNFTWEPAHLAVDGTITANFSQDTTVGWMWWLTGSVQILGFVSDDLSKARDRQVLVALPAFNPAFAAAVAASDCACQRVVPVNVNERELANNPQVYTEDPGSFCKPFSNPERVLSEKRFDVIARITQPEISPMSTVKSKSLSLLALDNDDTTGNGDSGAGGFMRLFRSPATRSRTELLLPTRRPIATRYLDLLKRLPSGRTFMDANHPLQWEDDIAQYQAATVSIGHILEFRVRWRSNGYSLGTVAKTLTLIPRQTKRIQKIEWERSERARRSELTQLRDQENDSMVRERDYSDSVAATLSEWASGGSSSTTAGLAGGIGFFAEAVLGGIGGGVATANSSSHAEGGRSTNASEQQRLRDAIRRHADALRKFESTVVNEVTQEETVTGTTEVIRNLNYAHSLTVIYYQILRHLKVGTEFAGVRECIFVPFAIKPFDIERAYRWRESIQAYIRNPLYSRALRYLKDVATNFTTSDIPPGARAEQPLTYLRGSLYVNLGIERPRDAADGVFDSEVWQVLHPMLETPALGIFSFLGTLNAANRDRTFQAEYAPNIAARWSNRIQFRLAGGRTISADCTLATRYQFNRSVRIDFAVPASELAGVTRQSLQQLTVQPLRDLPPGSVANLTRLSIIYNTDRFEHAVEGRTGTNDLISPVTGRADSATVVIPLDSWERVNERLEITRSVDQLLEHLNEHVEYYHKAIWWRMDRDRLLMMLDGFYVPNTNNVSIATVVDREPIGIIGNSIVYRVGAASFLGMGKVKTPADLYNLYALKEPVSDPLFVSLPTDGLYAQTIMDECNALEEHFGNRDWVLNDKDPELGTIDPSLLQSRRSDSTPATAPTPFPATIINLQNAPDAPAPSGLQGVLNAITNPNAFRDMAGLAGTQANAAAALTTAAGLATNFGNQAAALELAKLAKADQATRTADQKIASIKGAVDKGLTTPTEASKAAQNVLAAMNPDSPATEAPHENRAINSAIDAARSVPGSTIEASTGEGQVRVKVGGDEELFEDRSARSFIVPTPSTGTPENRAFNPRVSEKTGTILLSVRVRNFPSGGRVRWSVPPAQAGRFTLKAGATEQIGLHAEVTGLVPGPTFIDVEVVDSSGNVIESEKYPLNIPQFITIDIDAATFSPVLRGYGLVDAEIEDVLRVSKSVVDMIYSQTNIRTIWLMSPFNETLPAQFAAGGVAAANVTRCTFRGNPPNPNLLGVTTDSGGGNVRVGPRHFDEIIHVFVGAFDDPVTAGAARDLDDVTIRVVQAIAAAGLTSSAEKSLAMEVLGRLYGETIAHEIGHSLIGAALGAGAHNPSPGFTSDLMNNGTDRSFESRTGFHIDPTQIGVVDLATLLADDRGIFFINIPTTVAKAQLDAHFPVPPVFT